MKSPHRLGLVAVALLAVLLVLTGVALHSLLRLGSGMLALALAVVGGVAVLALGMEWSLARQAERQLGALLPPLPPRPPAEAVLPPLPRRAFQVREARPGEVPEAYLSAVLRGAQARRAAWKQNAPQPSDRV